MSVLNLFIIHHWAGSMSVYSYIRLIELKVNNHGSKQQHL